MFRYFNSFALMLLLCAGSLAGAARANTNAGQESVLYSFGGPDGAGPLYGIIGDGNGDIFGVTVFGGTRSIGTVFELSPGGTGYSESVLYNFRGPQDGDKPTGIVRDADGELFGFTAIDGPGGGGTVFKLAPARSGYRFSLLYAFPSNFYAFGPLGAPVLGKLGGLYGVTQGGGIGNSGIVFKLTPAGKSYTYSAIYSFPGGAGGYLPQAGLTSDSHGAIYGTTYYGGYMNQCSNAGCGEVFKITPTATGYRESTLYQFQSSQDGAQPFGVLTVDNNTGDVYGTTEYGGTGRHGGCGTVFKLKRTPAGYKHSILYNFNGQDGCLPEGQVFLGPSGTLFGTVAIGGFGCAGIGCGVVYELVPSGNQYVHSTLYAFAGPNHGAYDGAEPEQTNLIADASGALYGTTRSGGSKLSCGDGGPGGALGCGIVFKIVP